MALEALNSPVGPRFPDAAPQVFDSLTKRKPRSKRPRSETHSTEEEYFAACLVMLARSGGDEVPASASSTSSNSKTTTPPAAASEVPQPQNSPYKCSVCDKSFPTYQALGGHKASHRTKPPTDENKPSTSNSTGTAPTSNISALNPTGRPHICSVCKRSFPTGQALGGHKRRHYEGQIGGHGLGHGHHNSGGGAVVPSNTSGVTSSEGGVSSHKRPHHDFDLNLPASPEELGLGLINVDCGNKSEIYSDHEVESPMPAAADKKLRLSFPVDLALAVSRN